VSPHARRDALIQRIVDLTRIRETRKADIERVERNGVDMDARLDALIKRLERTAAELEKAVA
jgi:hypothetical protein